MQVDKKMFGGILSAVGALFVIIGSVMPWATVNGIFSVSKNGIDGDGKVTIILGFLLLVAGLAMFLRVDARVPVGFGVAFAIIVAVVGIIDIIDMANKFSGLSNQYAQVGIGAGLYLTIAGAALALFGLVLAGRGHFNAGSYDIAPETPSQYECAECGAAVYATTKFCPNCGRKLGDA